jgi:nicotinamide-nucleotide amidase|uniref:CinA family protein n=1 Tax=Eubacterium sp. TaxID=142586 RepID=UPI003FEF0624
MCNKFLTAEVVDKLIKKNWHISFAESCTGGKCCGALVDEPGASAVLDVSFITYANEAKIKYLGVSPNAIEEFGVVSEPVAAQMACGAAENAKSQVAVGITGVAGPTGGTAAKPVGMVCFGFFINGSVHTFTRQFGNIGRNQVRAESVCFVFEKLCELL